MQPGARASSPGTRRRLRKKAATETLSAVDVTATTTACAACAVRPAPSASPHASLLGADAAVDSCKAEAAPTSPAAAPSPLAAPPQSPSRFLWARDLASTAGASLLSGLRRLSLSPFSVSGPSPAKESATPPVPAPVRTPIAVDVASDASPCAVDETPGPRRRRLRKKCSLDSQPAAQVLPADDAPECVDTGADALAEALTAVNLAPPSQDAAAAVVCSTLLTAHTTGTATVVAAAPKTAPAHSAPAEPCIITLDSDSSSSSSSSSDDDDDSDSSPVLRTHLATAPRRGGGSASAAAECASRAPLVAVSDDEEEHNAMRLEFTDAASGMRCAHVCACCNSDARCTDRRPTCGDAGASARSFVLSARLSARLFPHQREGVTWIWGRHVASRGGILGDDMVRHVAPWRCNREER